MKKINTQAIKGVLPVLNNSLNHHEKEHRKLMQDISRLQAKWLLKGKIVEPLRNKINFLRSVIRYSKVFKTEQDLSLFQEPPEALDAEWLNFEKLMWNDPCVSPDHRFEDWYNHYHYLYLQENGKGL